MSLERVSFSVTVVFCFGSQTNGTNVLYFSSEVGGHGGIMLWVMADDPYPFGLQKFGCSYTSLCNNKCNLCR